MATKFYKNAVNEDVMAQKDALENLNTRKSTSRRILTSILSENFENSELKPNLRSINISLSGVLDRYDPG